jgi:hypothetical protein
MRSLCVPATTTGGGGGWLRLVIAGDTTEAPVDHLRCTTGRSTGLGRRRGRDTRGSQEDDRTDLDADVELWIDAGEKPRLEEECFQFSGGG